MAVESSWLVGSITITAATLTINGDNQVVAAGSYYLRDATAGLSLITAVQAAIAAEVAGSTVVVCKDRKVRFDFNATPTTITFPASIRAALGLSSGVYGPVTTLTAESVSTLLWSPGWPETTIGSPVGVAGRKVHDRVMTASPTGQTFDVTTHWSSTLLSLSWTAVSQARGWTTGQLAGEFYDFFDRIIVAGKRWKLYSNVTEDDASSAAVTWPTALGPYVVPDPDYDWYQRFNPRSDSLGSNISITDALLVGEYT